MEILESVIYNYCKKFNFPPDIVINNQEIMEMLISFIPTKILSIEEMNEYVGTDYMCYTKEEQTLVIMESLVDSLYSFYDEKKNIILVKMFKRYVVDSDDDSED